MLPHLAVNVHVAGLSNLPKGILTFDSHAGLFDEGMDRAAL
jgi:hypothetical protein